MAAASASSLSLSNSSNPSPPRNRLSNLLSSGRRRSSDVQSESGTSAIRNSLDSVGLTRSSTRSRSREGSIISGSASVKKLIPGHAKRERKRVREDELTKIVQEEEVRGRKPASEAAEKSTVERPSELNRSHSSLVTVDSDLESPPALTTRDSHHGFLTTTSPLIITNSVDEGVENAGQGTITNNHNISTEQFPEIIEPPATRSANPSPKSAAPVDSSSLPVVPVLFDKADTLRPNVDSSRVRGKSPARRFKDVFSRNGKSPRTSPERSDQRRPSTSSADLRKSPSLSFTERRQTDFPEKRGPSPLRAQTIPAPVPPAPQSAAPVLQTERTELPPTPKTPPSAIRQGPLTTVTPPTPTDHEMRRELPASPVSRPERSSLSERAPDLNGSNLQNTISHRRTRSASGASHQKSKLSTSTMAPLTPTIEEMVSPGGGVTAPGSRNMSMGGGFFSSWVSAAQNAANSITSLTNQNKGRAGTASVDLSRPKLPEEPITEIEPEKNNDTQDSPKKELAVTTLGSGDLNLGHLGIEAQNLPRAASPAGSVNLGSKMNLEDESAKMEDMLAKRAVSQAYERPGRSGEATPVAEIPDPVASARPASTFETSGTLTPPNGSLFEVDTGSVKRSNSVRSKLQNRRSRGSSVTTGQSTIGAIVGASTATLANPATGPKLSGFAIAPKQRNRAFHQQFRSVPEDDFLIEDYSCALQKEILLAGRLYISEGHICFSSNILGWVTTLIISFEEVVSIEKENTAIVIPNAIAVQTLHARHIFRSLLGREATYDLMIGIWRVSHPDSFQKSMNGKQLAAGDVSTDDVTLNGGTEDHQESEDESEDGSDSDEDDGSAPSVGSSGSIAKSEVLDTKSVNRNPPSNANGPSPASGAPSNSPPAEVASTAPPPATAANDTAQDFPGPATHAPTECTDGATHYDKVIKDEVIAAPLGKIYTLLFGPQSTAFVRKFLVDGVSKAQELQLEEDKKGLDNENKSRQYRYIKPLGGSIGPKQTNCITTENLDSLDLEKAVSVTCTTQTPDVPSGSAFSVKTRYCLSWAPGNATRFQMNMTIEWTAKSWLKGPIEKGALDGQIQYGDDLVKTLRGALGRSRAATTGSKAVKSGSKKKKKSSKKDKADSDQAQTKHDDNWGAFDILRPILGPIVAPVKPFVSMQAIVTVLVIMVLWMWIRGPSAGTGVGFTRNQRLQQIAIYDDLWRREESELWSWLQDRAGIDGSIIRDRIQDQASLAKENKQKTKQRQKLLKSKDIQSKLREEKKSMEEMEEAVRVTQERLEMLQRALERQRVKA